MESTGASEVIEQSTGSSEAPAPETQPTPAVTPGTGDGGIPNAGASAEPSAPAYTPNFKFNVMGKEHEFDPFLRSAIKDQETEKKVKELYEKAYGLDHVKPKYENTAKERDTLRQDYGGLQKEVSEVMEHAQSGDFDSFFKKIGVPIETVAQWIIDKAQRQNLPPEQKRVYDEKEALARQQRELSKQVSTQEERYRQLATQARAAEVDSVLARQDVNPIAGRYDAENGAGSFRQLVARCGVMHFNQFGEDPSAEKAFSDAMKLLGNAYRQPQAPVQPQTDSGQQQLPVIPNVSGKNISPVRKAPRSLDDLRKMASGKTT